jgi:hypothetical protein
MWQKEGNGNSYSCNTVPDVTVSAPYKDFMVAHIQRCHTVLNTKRKNINISPLLFAKEIKILTFLLLYVESEPYPVSCRIFTQSCGSVFIVKIQIRIRIRIQYFQKVLDPDPQGYNATFSRIKFLLDFFILLNYFELLKSYKSVLFPRKKPKIVEKCHF